MQEIEEYVLNELNSIIKTNSDCRIILGIEVQGGSQSARAAACLGMAKGVLANTINKFESLDHDKLEYYAFTPGEVKRKIGKGTITKEQIIDWACDEYNQIIDLKKKANSYVVNTEGKTKIYGKGAFEHIADSLVIARLIVDNIEKEKR